MQAAPRLVQWYVGSILMFPHLASPQNCVGIAPQSVFRAFFAQKAKISSKILRFSRFFERILHLPAAFSWQNDHSGVGQ